ncbi:MAG TPA: hypothetical protein VFV50_13090 [Bdellovibrionales bacterium]|nr:hypothetical protein [Bdellovibrionales bacterium]
MDNPGWKVLYCSIVAAVFALLLPLAAGANDEDLMDVEMAPSSGNEDMLLESTPVKPHDSVFIEDVEAQVRDAREQVKSTQKELEQTDAYLRKVKSKNYGDKKHLQKETIGSIERKKKADAARLKVERQKEALQKEILAYEKRRARAKERAEKAEDRIDRAQERLVQARQTKASMTQANRPPPPVKKAKKVRVEFGDEPRRKKGLAADAY